MPITYDPDTNTITVVGTKNGQPYTFEDIWQADVNNGWGKFLKLSEGVYKTTAKLQFGNGTTSTLFEEKETTLICENLGVKDGDTIIHFKDYCNATFGEYGEYNGEKVAAKGVEFMFKEETYKFCMVYHYENSDVKYYGCKFKLLRDSIRVDIQGYIKELVGCMSETILEHLYYTKVNKCLIIGEEGHLSGGVGWILSNSLIATTKVNALWVSNISLTIRGLIAVYSDRLATLSELQSPNVIKFVNCKPHNWKVNWILNSGQDSGELQRVYAVRFKVTDVNGNPLANRTVKVYDKNGNKTAEAVTDSNGLTDEVEILYAKLTNPYSDGQWHKFTDEDWEYFNPFTIEVWYGSELEYKGILTELDVDSTFIQLTVKPSSLTLSDIANKIEYVRKLVGNRWKIENNELKIYDDDNTTVIRRFKLYDKTGKPSEIEVYDRIPE